MNTLNQLTPVVSRRDQNHLHRRRTAGIAAAVLIGAAGLTGIGFGAAGLLDQAQATDTRTSLENPTTFTVDPSHLSPAPAPVLTNLGPDTLAAPAADLRVPLVHLGLGDDGNFAIPAPDKASIFTDGAPLSATEGSTFIAGHVVDKAGRFAPMARLSELRPGDRVVTTDSTGTRRDWIVTGARVVTRDGLDPAMWATSGPRQLVLVTCAGRIDAAVGAVTQFTENLVVTAVPAAD